MCEGCSAEQLLDINISDLTQRVNLIFFYGLDILHDQISTDFEN